MSRSTVPSNFSVLAYIKAKAQTVNQALSKAVPDGVQPHPKILFDAMRHSVFAGGKRYVAVKCLGTRLLLSGRNGRDGSRSAEWLNSGVGSFHLRFSHRPLSFVMYPTRHTWLCDCKTTAKDSYAPSRSFYQSPSTFCPPPPPPPDSLSFSFTSHASESCA